ncbi:hypothetical protein BFN03_17845 [Rhodococcus sp. WMMA185]|uniref:hypothetical protein n=1 Tax=Rhodococcus sp. WMMA185 TaxID=679318 RepID=UPI00087887E7|nr:hypothetical protein [Rhodococcus sp. WMMA185]AOW93893.1 hypothetical protein BFN03_17845 [Rhodococcus sp. WMMA185]
MQSVGAVASNTGEVRALPAPRHPKSLVILALCAVALLVWGPGAAGAVPVAVPQNPWMSSNPWNNIHNDAAFTDSYSIPGPAGSSNVDVQQFSEYTFQDPYTGEQISVNTGECPAHTYDADGNLQTVCGGYPNPLTNDFVRSIITIDPNGNLLAYKSFVVPFTNIVNALTEFGGIGYFYQDNQHRVVMGMPDGHIVAWERQDSPVSDVDQYVMARDINVTGTGGPLAGENFYALVPNDQGYIWFTTSEGSVGTVAPEPCTTDCIKSLNVNQFNDGTIQERISESHPVSGLSTFQQTDYFMYRLDMSPDGSPEIAWKAPYDRGVGQKSGQTSWGSGTSPSFFKIGDREFVTIVDNAVMPNIVVYRAEKNLRPGEERLFAQVAPFGDRTDISDENSQIVLPGSTPDSVRIYAENNWGNDSVLSTAGPLTTSGGFGGIEVWSDGRVEVIPANHTISVPSVVSKGNAADNSIITYEKRVDGWYLTALDASDLRQVLWSAMVGGGEPRFNNWYAQLSLAPGGYYYVGTLTGVTKVTPR